MVGDRLRDMQAGHKVGVRGILVGSSEPATYQPRVANLRAATNLILAGR
ncbi:HAD hydrolase-like protein [Hymenobacter sp. 5516J-16]|nr:HAD hydrolase-like protein [Hymenobacter sp. 5516J-16]